MSAEILEILYLQCDYQYGNDVRCPVTYPTIRSTGWPPNAEALEVLARKAEGTGWVREAA